MNLKKLSYGCCVVGAACLVGLGCNRSRLVLEPDGGASDPGGEAGGTGGAAGSEAVAGSGGFGGVGATGGGGGVAGAGGRGGFTGGNTGGNGGTVGDAGAEGDPAAGGTGGNDAWGPAIDHVNGTGWRNSTEPLCPKAGENLFGLSVWADARGTFVAVRSEADGSTMPLPDFCTGEICSRTDVFFNEGNGWQPWVRLQDELTHIEGGMQMRGLQGGPLVVANGLADTVRHQGCPLGMLRDDEGGVSTECESQPPEVHDLFTVGSSLAYAISGDRVIRYDGDSWGPLPAVLPYNDIDALWANESQLVVAGGQGTVLSLEDGQWRPHDTGTLEYIVTLWGFGPDNLWAGTSNGTLLHYDGVEWQSIDWGTPPCEPAIKGMWGAEGVLYVHSRTALRRVADDGTIETIAEWNCTHNGSNPGIREVWGRGPNELFLVVHETQRPRRGCGSAYMLWYDGEELRWF